MTTVTVNVTTDVTGFVGAGAGSTQVASGTITPTAGADGLLAIALGYGRTSGPISMFCSWDTNIITPLNSLVIDDTTTLYTFVANGADVTGHTGTRSIAFEASYTGPQVSDLSAVYGSAIFFEGVYQTTLVDAFTGSSTGPTTGANASIAIPSASGNMVVGIGATAKGSTWAAAAGSPNTATEFANVNGFDPVMEAQYADGAAPQTINATLTSGLWGMLGVSINATPGGGGHRCYVPTLRIGMGIRLRHLGVEPLLLPRRRT